MRVQSFFTLSIVFCLFFSGVAINLSAQTLPKGENLIFNGDFEQRNIGFESDYTYSAASAPPGHYSITRHASYIDEDFKDPVTGDHSESGYGYYMVANANDQQGKKVWYTKVQVIPNSDYNFEMYFCNLFRKLPPKTNFAFENGDVKGNDPVVKITIAGEVVAIERDMYHMFKWLKASAVWYSGVHNGPVIISIENLNTNMSGNDLAIDDLQFTYIETKPAGYIPPEKITTLMSKDYTPVLKDPNEKVPISAYGIYIDRSDTLNNGIHAIQYKKPLVITPADTAPVEKNEKIVLKNLMFSQGKPELLPDAVNELNVIAEWMQRDPSIRLRFIGHTDNQGDSLLNVKLSEQRVQNVKNYLVKKGIAAERIEIVGLGGAFPIADNSREETRRLNRRVEMEILK